MLAATTGGSRRALIVLLIYALVAALWFGAASLVLFLSVPAELVLFSSSLIAGILAAIALFRQLWRAPSPT